MGRIFYAAFAGLALFACSKGVNDEKSSENAPNDKSVAAESTTAKYLANEGVMITRGDTKVLFDPLFDNTYGQYMPLPLDMRAGLLEGTFPYDGIDAVLISHSHGDHFSAADVITLMEANPKAKLIAPQQAVDDLTAALGEDKTILDRVETITLAYKDKPIEMVFDNIRVEAVRIPHAGWPDPRRATVENISYRVTIDEKARVVHMGDADVNDVHFSDDAEYWAKGRVDMAFPPYWFLQSDAGNDILQTRIRAEQTIGTHVPSTVAPRDAQRSSDYKGLNLFIIPGDERIIPE